MSVKDRIIKDEPLFEIAGSLRCVELLVRNAPGCATG